MTLLICCLLAIAGFVVGGYLCRVSDGYARLFSRAMSPTPELLRLALIAAWRRRNSKPRPVLAASLFSTLLVVLWLAPLNGLQMAALALALILLWLLALIDRQICVLPDALTQPLLWAGLALAWYGDALVTLEMALTSAMLSYLVLRALSELYRLIRQREGLGRGDVKLIAAVSAWLGWHDTLWVVVLGSLFGLMLALYHRPSLTAPQPFGPPLILATLLTIALRVAEQVP